MKQAWPCRKCWMVFIALRLRVRKSKSISSYWDIADLVRLTVSSVSSFWRVRNFPDLFVVTISGVFCGYAPRSAPCNFTAVLQGKFTFIGGSCMRKVNLAVASLLVGGAAFAGFVRADKPALAAQPPVVTLTAEEPAEVQHLREVRKHLNMAKDLFEKDPVDKKDHRKAILESIDKSINEVDAEIDELLGK